MFVIAAIALSRTAAPGFDWLFNFDQSYRSLTSHFGTNSLKGFGCENLEDGVTAAGVIFYHIKNELNGNLDHVLFYRLRDSN